MEKYILAIDQGTTSSRAILFDHEGKMVLKAQREIVCKFPHPGWVEEDANTIFTSVIDCITEVMINANISPDEINSIAITNQRETTIVWDKKTGMPVYNAVVWQSRQSADICEALEDKKDFIKDKTGLFINPYFSASKLRFILDHIPNGQCRAENGELMFGTVDCWLIYKLTKRKVFATDVTNASRTLLFNIQTMKWDEELCKIFNIPMCMLPDVKPSSYRFGDAYFDGNVIPISGVAGDQQAALFGQTCFKKGDSKCTYGTGCFMLMNTGDKPVVSKNGLLTTVAWQIGDKVTYALEGSVFIGGAVVQWLRDEMKLIESSSQSEERANECHDTHGVYVVPAFVGLGTPYWDGEARGAVFGLTRGSNRNHFVRASLDSIAYQCKDLFTAMQNDLNVEIKTLKVDGGATANKYLMQFQSDILQAFIKLPTCLETTALGAAYLAGLNTGFYSCTDEIEEIHSYQAIYEPKMDKEHVDKLYEGWIKAVKATRMFK